MDAVSLKILRVYSSRQKLTLIELGAIMNASPVDLGQYVLRLKDKAYLCVSPDYAALRPSEEKDSIGPDTPLQITIDGKEALEDHDRTEKKNCMNTAFSVIAIVISLLALLAQLGLIPLPRL